MKRLITIAVSSFILATMSGCSTYNVSDANIFDFGSAPSRTVYNPPGPYFNSKGTFVFSPRQLTWYAFDPDGTIAASGRASGGQHYCADVGRGCKTPIGRFSVHRKGDVTCISNKYPLGGGGARMPYCMFFHGGYAIHGATNVPNYNASHGCIRVFPGDAAWLSQNFIRHGTTVIVKPY